MMELPFVRVDQLVEALFDEFQHIVNGPFAFWGHCLGGICAYELSLLLEKKLGLSPETLFVSGCPAPNRTESAITIHDKSNVEFIDTVRQLNKNSFLTRL